MTTDGDQNARRLGDFIRMQRQMADLSLRGMAELTQVSNAYLSQVERGLHQPSIRVLRSIAEALNLSADTLLAQAGLHDSSAAGGNATEEAIRNDPSLRPADKDALIRVYQSLRQEASSDE